LGRWRWCSGRGMMGVVLGNVLMRRLGLALVLLVAACGSDSRSRQVPVVAEAEAVAEGASACGLAPVPLRRPGAARVVAIGDLHGDLEAARGALRLAGAIDERDQWIGGDELVVVQTGDLLDRGDDEPEILALLESLPVVWLNGNHELMNAAGDFRYVTAGGFEDYGGLNGRARSYRPGGTIALQLAGHNVVAIVGDTVFVHGGVLPVHVEHGLERLNEETRCWLAGKRKDPPATLVDPLSPVWMRDYSRAPERCDLLAEVLGELGVARMVVGHTPQPAGISSGCNGKIWRIDVGLARFYGGPMQVLEIADGQVRVLTGER